MAPRAIAVVFGLTGRQNKYNKCVTQVLEHNAEKDTYLVVTAGGTTVGVPGANVFLQSKVPRLFAAALADTPALEDLATVRDGAHGREVVAPSPIPPGTVLKTRVVQIVMTTAEIDDVETHYVTFIKRELNLLMGLPEDYEQEVIVQTDYSVSMVFMRKIFETRHHPDLQSLMSFNSLADPFLTEQWDRTAAQDLLWLYFCLDDFAPEIAAGEISPIGVWHIFAFTHTWAFPHPTPEHKHISMLFGVILSAANTPKARWDDIVKVSKGTMTPQEAEARHEGVLLSTVMFHDIVDGYLRLFNCTDLTDGHPIEFDYVAGYGSPLDQTVNNLGNMPQLDQLFWFNVYITIATSVSPELARHLTLYLTRRMPALLQPATAVTLPRCANAACNKPLFQHRLCGKCKTAKYSTRECQVAAWNTHKRECKTK
jgi:hypothetical protein